MALKSTPQCCQLHVCGVPDEGTRRGLIFESPNMGHGLNFTTTPLHNTALLFYYYYYQRINKAHRYSAAGIV